MMLGLALLVGQFWLWMRVRTSLEEWRSASSLEEQREIINSRSGSIEGVLRQQKILLDQLSIVAPPVANVSQLIDRLERMADERQLTVRVRNIAEGRGQGVVPLDLEIRATGSMDDLLSYLQAIEHLQELTRLTQWTVSQETVRRGVQDSQTTVASEQLYSMSMNMSFYVQLDQVNGQE